MALVKCPECARQVSDQAPTCPQCGYPIAVAGRPLQGQPTELHTTHQEKGTFGKSFGETAGSKMGELTVGCIGTAILVPVFLLFLVIALKGCGLAR
jgi:DNA-directed RNA polymerase subunit RPC12/RpoP